jgi:SAM-dependent methyltransferase
VADTLAAPEIEEGEVAMHEDEPNVAERRRWNDAAWTSVWPKREAMTSVVTGVLLGHLDLHDGERLLDVGSGGGTASLAAADRVGPGGAVVGADISVALVELAQHRAAERQLQNVSFLVADVQREAVPGAPFDVAGSQFGVMFFDEPVTAFANIRRQVSPGGRLGFVCWQAVERNPWFLGPALAGYVPPPPPPGPGKRPTGPFSLSDPAQTFAILADAGWSSVDRTPYELVATVEWDAVVGDGQLKFLGVAEASLGDARRVVEEHLAPLRTAEGRIQTPLSVQVFTAQA